jgi:hypothetical protein
MNNSSTLSWKWDIANKLGPYMLWGTTPKSLHLAPQGARYEATATSIHELPRRDILRNLASGTKVFSET